METSSSSGLLKRAKTPSSMAHVTSCLVDGCDSDLSLGREYHRRHKVCELHSKTPKVAIRGLEQRFCQQCSRFHSLVEFDEGKRSCRKRLDGHNRRRRKPQSETSQSQNTGTGGFYPNQQGGTTFLSFGGPQLLPRDFTWPGDQCFNYFDRHESFPGQAAYNYGEVNQFKIMHGNEVPEVSDSSLCQPLLDANNSDCALSLLSPAPAETQESALNLSRMAPYSSIHFCDPSLQSSQGMELSKPPVSALISSFVGYNANLHFQGMSQNLPDGPSSDQALSFRWE